MEIELPLQAQIDLWRQRAIAGTLSDDELRDAVRRIREDRVTTAQTRVARTKTVPARSVEDLLASFGDEEGEDTRTEGE